MRENKKSLEKEGIKEGKTVKKKRGKQSWKRKN